MTFLLAQLLIDNLLVIIIFLLLIELIERNGQAYLKKIMAEQP